MYLFPLIAGVVIDRRGTSSLQSFVTAVWEDLRFAKALNNVEMNFVRIKKRIDMTMDELIEGGERKEILVYHQVTIFYINTDQIEHNCR